MSILASLVHGIRCDKTTLLFSLCSKFLNGLSRVRLIQQHVALYNIIGCALAIVKVLAVLKPSGISRADG